MIVAPRFASNPHISLQATGTSGYRVYQRTRLIGVVVPIGKEWRYATRDRFPRNVNGHTATLTEAVASICRRNDVPWTA